MQKKTNQKVNRNRNTKPSYFIDWNGSSTVETNFAEKKRVYYTYYGIGKDRDTGKESVLDYQSKFPSEAKAYFEMEFNALNADLVGVGVYK